MAERQTDISHFILTFPDIYVVDWLLWVWALAAHDQNGGGQAGQVGWS